MSGARRATALLAWSLVAGAASAACAQRAGAGTSTDSESPDPKAWRVFALLRFGQVGSARLETPRTALEGEPVHSFGFGARLELAPWRALCAGLEASIGAVSGADLATESEERIGFTPIDVGLIAAPRLLLLEGRVELRVQLSAGLSSLLFLEGEFPVTGAAPLNRYAFAEGVGLGVYGAAGIGLVTWLNAHVGAFFELYAARRHARAQVKPGTSAFDSDRDLPESTIALDETHFFVLIGFGIARAAR